MTSQKNFASVDEYINSFSGETKATLENLRAFIKELLPNSKETISYQMPTFNVNGKYVIYFAGWKKHISLYPVPSGDSAFNAEIADYITGRGTIQFPLDKPIPYNLVKKIVEFRLRESSL